MASARTADSRRLPRPAGREAPIPHRSHHWVQVGWVRRGGEVTRYRRIPGLVQSFRGRQRDRRRALLALCAEDHLMLAVGGDTQCQRIWATQRGESEDRARSSCWLSATARIHPRRPDSRSPMPRASLRESRSLRASHATRKLAAWYPWTDARLLSSRSRCVPLCSEGERANGLLPHLPQ